MIWATTGIIPAQLLTLQDVVIELLGTNGLVKTFRPNITLARFRPQDRTQFPFKNIKEPVCWSMRTEKISLFHSVPSSTGSSYHIIEHLLL